MFGEFDFSSLDDDDVYAQAVAIVLARLSTARPTIVLAARTSQGYPVTNSSALIEANLAEHCGWPEVWQERFTNGVNASANAVNPKDPDVQDFGEVAGDLVDAYVGWLDDDTDLRLRLELIRDTLVSHYIAILDNGGFLEERTDQDTYGLAKELANLTAFAMAGSGLRGAIPRMAVIMTEWTNWASAINNGDSAQVVDEVAESLGALLSYMSAHAAVVEVTDSAITGMTGNSGLAL